MPHLKGYKWKLPRWQRSVLFYKWSLFVLVPGHRAFESPKVNNTANFVSIFPDVVGFLDLRSYGQMNESDLVSSIPSYLVYVWSPHHFCIPARTSQRTQKTWSMLRLAQQIRWTFGIWNTFRFQLVLFRLTVFFLLLGLPDFAICFACPREYPDWMYKVVGVTYSYVAHLRDTEIVRSRKSLTIYNSTAFHRLRAGSDPL